MAVICCLFRSAGLVVDLFKEAGRALQSMPMLLIQPLFTFIALMIFFVYWSLVVILLATSCTLSFFASFYRNILHHFTKVHHR